jgi:hypothetical protein
MIEAFTGLPGQGKTYLMTRMALKKMKKGYTVYANYPLKGAIRFNQIHEVFHVENAVILLDEAGLVAPSGSWKSIPFEVMAHWRMHRHHGVDLYYTAQDLQDVAVPLRRVTQFVNEVTKFGPFIKWRCYMPRSKGKYGGGLHIFDQTIADQYDSYAKDFQKQEYLNS